MRDPDFSLDGFLPEAGRQQTDEATRIASSVVDDVIKMSLELAPAKPQAAKADVHQEEPEEASNCSVDSELELTKEQVTYRDVLNGEQEESLHLFLEDSYKTTEDSMVEPGEENQSESFYSADESQDPDEGMGMEVDKGPDCSENSPCGSSATDAVACPADSSEVAESSGHDEPHGCIASKELSGQAVSDYQEMKEDCQDDLMDAQAAAALECSRVAVEEADSTVGLDFDQDRVEQGQVEAEALQDAESLDQEVSEQMSDGQEGVEDVVRNLDDQEQAAEAFKVNSESSVEAAEEAEAGGCGDEIVAALSGFEAPKSCSPEIQDRGPGNAASPDQSDDSSSAQISGHRPEEVAAADPVAADLSVPVDCFISEILDRILDRVSEPSESHQTEDLVCEAGPEDQVQHSEADGNDDVASEKFSPNLDDESVPQLLEDQQEESSQESATEEPLTLSTDLAVAPDVVQEEVGPLPEFFDSDDHQETEACLNAGEHQMDVGDQAVTSAIAGEAYQSLAAQVASALQAEGSYADLNDGDDDDDGDLNSTFPTAPNNTIAEEAMNFDDEVHLNHVELFDREHEVSEEDHAVDRAADAEVNVVVGTSGSDLVEPNAANESEALNFNGNLCNEGDLRADPEDIGPHLVAPEADSNTTEEPRDCPTGSIDVTGTDEALELGGSVDPEDVGPDSNAGPLGEVEAQPDRPSSASPQLDSSSNDDELSQTVIEAPEAIHPSSTEPPRPIFDDHDIEDQAVVDAPAAESYSDVIKSCPSESTSFQERSSIAQDTPRPEKSCSVAASPAIRLRKVETLLATTPTGTQNQVC